MSTEIQPNEALLSTLTEVAAEMSAKLDAERAPWEPSDHSRSNWAREIGHPCKKHLVHCRVDWRQKQPIDTDGIWRVEEGLRIEWEVKKWLGNIGYEVTKSQRKFTSEDPGMEEFAGLCLSGKIDGMSPLHRKLPDPFSKLREVPIEVKTVNPNYWDSTQTLDAVKHHRAYWIAMIPDQLNVYLKFSRAPGGILVLVTFGKKPRFLPMLFDPDLWARTEATCLEVNRHVKAKTYPQPIPYDPSACGMCDFNHICQPVKTTTMTEIAPSEIFILREYLERKEARDRFEELHATLIGNGKKPGRYHGKEGIIEDIVIKTERQARKTYEVPKDVKEKFRGPDSEVIITTIERMDK
jgi:CRISPR/Cas system-associated exonuclease Cas4 (RecB family)